MKILLYFCTLLTFNVLRIVEGQQPLDPFSVHILETYQGIEPEGIECRLYKKVTANNNDWVLLKSRLTNGRGRANDFIERRDYSPGVYKFWFNSTTIYRRARVASFLPFVEIVFEVINLNADYHVPVIISPFHLTTNKGVVPPLNTNPNAMTAAPLPNPIASSVFDITNGRPATNLRGDLYYRLENGDWKFITSKITTPTGGFRNLFNDSCEFIPGVYKMSFDTKTYWNALGLQSFYSSVDIILDVKDTSAVVFTPVLINPYGYSFYKGGGLGNGVPCPTTTMATTTTATAVIPGNNHRPSGGIIGAIFSFLGLG